MRLLDRDGEISAFARALEASGRERGSATILSGPVASGKTRLLTAFGDYAADHGALWLSAVSSLGEQNLPLGVVRQLLDGAVLPDSPAGARIPGVLDRLPHGPQERDLPHAAATMRELWSAVLALSKQRPVVLGVDDAHFADEASLQCLLYFVRRLGSARVMVLLTRCEGFARMNPVLDVELPRRPHTTLVRLRPLSRQAVHSFLLGRLGPAVTDRQAEEWYALTRGNPLLVQALADDIASLPEGLSDRPPHEMAGSAFARSMLACLHRGHPGLLAVARGIAVLENTEHARVLEDLTGLDAAAVGQALHELTGLGLLEHGRFRHEITRTVIVNDLEPGRLPLMHRHIATCLRGLGAPALVIAKHLVAASRADAPWELGVLREASARAIGSARFDLAIDILALAARSASDPRDRALMTALLAHAEWCRDPGLATRHLGALRTALARGTLSSEHAHDVLGPLLWHGRFDEIPRTLAALRAREAGTPGELSPQVRLAHQQVMCSAPHLVPSAVRSLPAQHRTQFAYVEARRRALATNALAGVLCATADAAAVAGAEEVLRSAGQADFAPDVLEPALFALIYSDRTEQAAYWCERLAEDTAMLKSDTWAAMLCAIRAEIAVRHGALGVAAGHAERALSILPAQSWGAAVALPLSCLVRARSEMREYEAVQRLLGSPVPDGMLQSRWGMHYLHSRGRHYAATGRPLFALGDFMACGDYMTTSGIDIPALVPWRTHAAEALLRTGQETQAAQLLEKEVARLGPAALRARGVALRVLSRLRPGPQRPLLLQESLAALQPSGDMLELAYVLAELSEAFHEVGDFSKARIVGHQATSAAEQCGARTLLERIGRVDGGHGPKDVPAGAAGGQRSFGLGGLSVAEWRVARLAAHGHTNREISAKLHVTVSTVEQHLTRIYRKLGISGRGGLPSWLSTRTPGMPGPAPLASAGLTPA
ncbi:AAA family ATPase [Streptomyces sp. NPDC001930]|uniref:helix-turn-helix transcriptional regulator n=1 Tax=Streptomyces sp. NPDC001930 TaxID=3364625 RepID=UPI003688AA75